MHSPGGPEGLPCPVPLTCGVTLTPEEPAEWGGDPGTPRRLGSPGSSPLPTPPACVTLRMTSNGAGWRAPPRSPARPGHPSCQQRRRSRSRVLPPKKRWGAAGFPLRGSRWEPQGAGRRVLRRGRSRGRRPGTAGIGGAGIGGQEAARGSPRDRPCPAPAAREVTPASPRGPRRPGRQRGAGPAADRPPDAGPGLGPGGNPRGQGRAPPSPRSSPRSSAGCPHATPPRAARHGAPAASGPPPAPRARRPPRAHLGHPRGPRHRVSPLTAATARRAPVRSRPSSRRAPPPGGPAPEPAQGVSPRLLLANRQARLTVT